jgi:ADP-heptose:LPS heptosyltransferase
MRGRYLVQSASGATYLTILDAALDILTRRATVRERPVQRLVLGIGGHIGDAIIATGALRAIRDAAPHVEIGVVAASWALPVFEGHPSVARVHTVDHWKLNRTATSRLTRIRRSIATHHDAVVGLREVAYDAAVDLYPYYPNMSVLFERAGIPVRVGYESGGGRSAFTRSLPWRVSRGHMMQSHIDLVSELFETQDGPYTYDLAPIPAAAEERARQILSERGVRDGYVILHPGTGAPHKAWPTERWLELIRGLMRASRTVVVTGAGIAEVGVADELRRQNPAVVDLTGHTTLSELRAIFRRAAVVIAPDSAAGHLAAAENVPIVTVMAGMNDLEQWKPVSPTSVVLTKSVPCSPCFRSRGCATMECVRDVSVQSVLDEALRFSPASVSA